MLSIPNELYAALAGALLGAFVTYRLALNLMQRQHALDRAIADREARRKACASIRAAFAPTLAFVYIARHHGTHDRPNVDATVKNALLLHGAAIEEFRPFVNSRDGAAYQEAWEKYRKASVDCAFARWGEEKDWKFQDGEILEKNIHAVLEFADA